MPKIRLALVYGGMSGEHSISLVTAASVMRALDMDAYDVTTIGIRKDGTWVPGASDPSELEALGFQGEVPESDRHIVLGMNDRTFYVAPTHGSGALEKYAEVDVVFPLLHGPFGEDGTIQGMFEMAQIPYVGCGVFSSAAAMDKHVMKLVLNEAGIPYAPYVVVTRRKWEADPHSVEAEISEKLTYPVFVKPARAGSSLGVSKVDNPQQLGQAFATAHAVDPKALVETGIEAREIECAVLGSRDGGRPRGGYLGEIVLGENEAGFYDYANKYLSTAQLQLQIPADIDPPVAKRMHSMALDVFEAFECEGLTRVDFFLTPHGDIMVNELNTMPGFTSVSMYPKMWEKAGLPYSQLLDELIGLALDRPIGIR